MPKSKLADRLTVAVASFFGSWLSIILHTVWMVLWFMLDGDINLLTLLLSIEAIYIGIFILMTQNWERQQDLSEQRMERWRQKQRLDEDLNVDQKTESRLNQQTKQLRELITELKELKVNLGQ